MIEIQVPGFGVVEFPDGTPTSVMEGALRQFAQERGLDRGPPARAAEAASMERLETAPPEIEYRDVLPRATGGIVDRPNVMMATGGAGGALGMPAGPLGAVTGGMLGTMAGSLGYDAAEILARQLKGLPVPPEMRGMGPTQGALEMGALDIGTAGAAPYAGRGIKRVAGRAAQPMTAAARRIADMAEQAGIDLGIAHVSPRKWVRGASQVLGVLPLVSGPFRRGQEQVVAQIDAKAASLLNELAPMTAKGEMSKEMVDTAVKRYEKYGGVASVFFKRFNALAEALPEAVNRIVPTKPVRNAVLDIQDRIAKERIKGIAPPAGPDPVGDYLSQFADISKFGGNITVQQARGIEREINALAQRGRVEGFDTSRLAKVKAALEESKNNLDLSQVPAESAQAIKAAWDKALMFFHEAGLRFETATAKRFGRVDRNIFGKKFFEAGSINRDEVFDAAFNAGSVEAMRDLRSLVGPPAFRQASREFLADSYRAAQIPAKEGSGLGQLFSAAKFEKKLRLDAPDGQAAMTEMLRGSNTKLDDWLRFLEVAKHGTDIVIRDPSTYLTRRLVLTGAVLGAGGAAGVLAGRSDLTISSALVLGLAGRSGAKFLMNPKNLHDLTRVMLPGAEEAFKKNFLTRLVIQSGPEIVEE